MNALLNNCVQSEVDHAHEATATRMLNRDRNLERVLGLQRSFRPDITRECAISMTLEMPYIPGRTDSEQLALVRSELETYERKSAVEDDQSSDHDFPTLRPYDSDQDQPGLICSSDTDVDSSEEENNQGQGQGANNRVETLSDDHPPALIDLARPLPDNTSQQYRSRRPREYRSLQHSEELTASRQSNIHGCAIRT